MTGIESRNSQAAAEAVAAQVGNLGVRSKVILADLRDPDAGRRLVQVAWEEWGGIDIWVNNAGADTLTGGALQWPFERKLAELLAIEPDFAGRHQMIRHRPFNLRHRGRGLQGHRPGIHLCQLPSSAEAGGWKLDRIGQDCQFPLVRRLRNVVHRLPPSRLARLGSPVSTAPSGQLHSLRQIARTGRRVYLDRPLSQTHGVVK